MSRKLLAADQGGLWGRGEERKSSANRKIVAAMNALYDFQCL